jgi:hypothetical protein
LGRIEQGIAENGHRLDGAIPTRKRPQDFKLATDGNTAICALRAAASVSCADKGVVTPTPPISASDTISANRLGIS